MSELKLTEEERRDLERALADYEGQGAWCGATKIIAHFSRRLLASPSPDARPLPTMKEVLDYLTLCTQPCEPQPAPTAARLEMDRTVLAIAAAVEEFMRVFDEPTAHPAYAAGQLRKSLASLVRP